MIYDVVYVIGWLMVIFGSVILLLFVGFCVYDLFKKVKQ